jgi:hypothetical protein
MNINIPFEAYWEIEDYIIPVTSAEAKVLNQFINGIQREEHNWRGRILPAINTSTQCFDIELYDKNIEYDYHGDCCLTNKNLKTIEQLIRKIDCLYVFFLREKKIQKYNTDKLGKDVRYFNWEYGSFTEYDRDKRRTHVSPIVKNHITVRWRTYNMAEYKEDEQSAEDSEKLNKILNKYLSRWDRFFIERMI